jgi:hypothetical protein
MKSISKLALLIVAILSTPAQAGIYAPEELQFIAVGDCPGVAFAGMFCVQGAMGNVRFSSSGLSQIGCSTAANKVTSPIIFCVAVDIFGNVERCMTDDPGIIDTARSISTYSFIKWGVFDGQFFGTTSIPECQALVVANRSMYIPDTTDQNPGGGPN